MTTAEIAEIAKVTDDAKGLLREDLSPSRYVEVLESKKLFKDAVAFLVHGLPLPIGMQWGCRCCRELLTEGQLEKSAKPLQIAETWAKTPSEESRVEARPIVSQKEDKGAPEFLAMGVFFSGGSIADPSAPEVAPPPYFAQKMVSGGIQAAVLTNEPEKAEDRYAKALQLGRDVVKGR